MKMNFVLSETDNGAMQEALSFLAKQSREQLDENFIVVAPETKTLFVERFLLDEIPSHAFANIYVYSFNRLLKKIQTTKRLPLSKQGAVMIVRNIILKNQDKLVCYKKTAKTVGFAESVYDTIQQLKSSGVEPQEFLLSGSKLSSALKIKTQDISMIYQEYENYIGENLLDLNDRLEMLEKESENSNFIKNSHIFVVGFDSLTSNMVNVVKSFVQNAKTVTVSASFLHPSKKNSHISENEVFEHLKRIADDFHICYEPVFVPQKLTSDFAHLKENLYSYPITSAPLCGNVEVFGTPSVKDECRMVASKIKKSVLKGQRRYGEIYCYLANPEIQNCLVEQMEDFGVPCFVSSPYEEENHQFYQFIKSIFSLSKKNLDCEEIIKFARNNLLFLDSKKVDDFENYVLKYGTSYTRFLKPFENGKENISRLENAEEVRQNIIDVFMKFVQKISDKEKTSEIVQGLFEFFDEFKMEERLEKLEAVQLEFGERREALATKQIFGKASEVLQMLSHFLGEQKMTLDEFYSLLISGLDSDDISLLPLGVDEVQIVCSPDSIYRATDIYVLGATDGCFPRRELDLGLISDGEIVTLEGVYQKKIEPTIRTINRRERFEMFQLVLAPKNLCISFSDHLLNGEESKMSSLTSMIASLFTKNDKEYVIRKYMNVYDDQVLDFDELLYCLGSVENAVRFLAESIVRYKNGVSNVPLDTISKLYYLLEDELDEETKKQIEQINIDFDFEKLDNADKLFFKNQTTSISELESYFACPFKHFVSYGLRLKERELSSMKALDVGDIMHACAEQFMKIAVKKPDIEVEKTALGILKSVLENERYSKEDNVILIKILEKEVVRLCLALKKEMQSSSFKTILTESWFGKGGEFPGILLSENPKVEIVGKIDRIDQALVENGQKYYRIIDYKTGKIEANPVDIYYGKKLQLAVYLDAIKNNESKPAGVLYFPIHNEYVDSKNKVDESYRCKGFVLNDKDVVLKMDNTLSFENPKSKFIGVEISTKKANVEKDIIELKSSSSLISEEEIESISSYVLLLAKKAVREILDGFIKPTPLKKSKETPCEYCSFKNICGIKMNADSWTREATTDCAKDFYKGGKTWQE